MKQIQYKYNDILFFKNKDFESILQVKSIASNVNYALVDKRVILYFYEIIVEKGRLCLGEKQHIRIFFAEDSPIAKKSIYLGNNIEWVKLLYT